ncbi:MAG: hypothetical protein E6G26_00990 [Actinobacteria bacterium]|nr:MAG: hypothetical protein E6G26_00990 [Actinomycetota bacterium]
MDAARHCRTQPESPSNTTVTATFDAPVKSANVTLADSTGRAVRGSVMCNSPCTTVTVTPSTRLKKGTTYSAKATGPNAASQGSTTWTFTTNKPVT